MLVLRWLGEKMHSEDSIQHDIQVPNSAKWSPNIMLVDFALETYHLSKENIEKQVSKLEAIKIV